MSSSHIRFGVWALVHGSRAALQDPDEPYDASWARNRALVLEAERLGYDSVLIAQHTMNPHDENLDQLEAWSASAALAALTQRIEIIAAIKPYLYHPVVLAKMAQQIEHISGGRFAINLVNAWNRAELERAGIGFAEHDARYAYGREWISVVDAFFDSGRLKAGTPFEIASTPVSAVAPCEKAFSNANSVMPVTASSFDPIMKSMWISDALTSSPSPPASRNGKPCPNATWLAAFSSSSVS